MAVYKIPQNVEAEDKLLGPFTFKQFIFLLLASIGIFVMWLMYRIGASLLIIIPLPFTLIFLILGLYRRPDQPVESYLLAAVNYYIKPHRRTWRPQGQYEAVVIKVPKKKEGPKNKKDIHEVHGQLERLASIVDTRGWSTKRPELTETLDEHVISSEDRLVSIEEQQSGKAQPIDVHEEDDVMDIYNNRNADDLGNLAAKTTQNAKTEAIAKMRAAANQQLTPPAPAPVNAARAQTAAPATAQPAPAGLKYDPYPAMQQKTIQRPTN